ncbi:MFS transporter [Actinomadura livida]|uniref:Fucose permease n=1 Tax=Actinomadura livida TaxID=79909 RepID=A0A7W7IGF5_9ACTN|nr:MULTISPECIES: MFS transporter [Actinomadura]MBB4776638.1 fucose permease [Actinomadura catellatispora]GGT93726.1 MFS transporter [Actinomadura livida]
MATDKITAGEFAVFGRARTAVTLAFTAHGLLAAAWVVRIPQIKEHLGLSEGSMGVALLGAPVGVVLAVRFARRIIADRGSRATTIAAGVAGAASLVPLGLAWNLGALIVSLLLLGASLGLMDVAMNAQGVAVERGYGRPLMSGLHGWYSIGTLVAALIGSAVAYAGVPVPLHLSAAAAALAALTAIGCRGLLDRSADALPEPGPYPPDEPAPGAPPTAGLAPAEPVPDGPGPAPVPSFRWLPALLGIIGLCSFVGEGAVADWSAVYLREHLGTGPGFAGLGYAGCAVAMTAGRFAGDRVVARFGPVPALRAGSLAAALGLGAGLAAAHPVAAVAGFTVFGLGIAVVAPITFSAAGNVPGVPAAAGISRVTGIGYLGLLGGPPVIGFVAQGVGLGWALAVPVGLVGLIVLLAPATATAAPRADRGTAAC